MIRRLIILLLIVGCEEDTPMEEVEVCKFMTEIDGTDDDERFRKRFWYCVEDVSDEICIYYWENQCEIGLYEVLWSTTIDDFDSCDISRRSHFQESVGYCEEYCEGHHEAMANDTTSGWSENWSCRTFVQN